MDTKLSELAGDLPGYCLQSKALNTQRKYRYAFDAWCNWCKTFSNQQIQALPASDYYVSLYIVHLSKTFKSSSKINEAVYAISWAHKLAGFSDPCQSFLVKSVKEGGLRSTAQPVCKKEPITPEILKSLVSIFGTKNSSLADLRIASMCLLSFAGFLRFSELVNIRRSHITFHKSHLSLFIPKSKTDVLHRGNEVLISKTDKDTCPVSMLRLYLQTANINELDDCFIFRSITFCKKSNSFKLRGTQPLSYTRAREILLSALEKLGLDRSKFGLHSLRSGGATSAANRGIGDRLFKKHGRWSSENAKDGYVHESVSEKLSVTKALGI